MSEGLNLNNTHNLVKHYCYLMSNKHIPNALCNIITNYLYIYKISYNEAYKILTRGSCCAGFWSENQRKYRCGILACKFKSTKKLMIAVLSGDVCYNYKIIHFPLSTDIMDCSHEYKTEQIELNEFKHASEDCLLGYYSDDTELKYKEYPTFIKSYHNYLSK